MISEFSDKELEGKHIIQLFGLTFAEQSFADTFYLVTGNLFVIVLYLLIASGLGVLLL